MRSEEESQEDGRIVASESGILPPLSIALGTVLLRESFPTFESVPQRHKMWQGV